MAKQEELDAVYLDMAYSLSQLSNAKKAKVGCLIVNDTHIISEGVNGTPTGFDNTCEDMRYQMVTKYGNNQYEGSSWVEEFCKPMPDGSYLTPRHNVVRKVLATKPEVLHAESNAISKIARSTNSSEGATMYITLSPCFDCAKLIIQAGIVRVVYSDEYRCREGIELLNKAGIEVVHYE